MRKKISLISLSLIVAFSFTACTKNIAEPSNENLPSSTSSELNIVAERSDINHYTINASLDTASKTLTATQQVKYVNTENVDLAELYFHVYANAFKNKETAPFLFDSFESAYNRGFEPGYTEVQKVELISDTSKLKLNYSFQGVGDTIMKVQLAKPLKPSETVEIEMNYIVHIPPANERFGWSEHTFNLGNWYPIAAVYDETGWNLDKYYAIGDPFYSDSANYDVSITAPKEFTIASSGQLMNEKDADNSKIWTFKTNSMRDFAFIASDLYEVLTQNVNGTEIKSYFYKDNAYRGKKALEAGVKSISLFNEKFGKYPYPNYSVVETVFPSGMEYPGLVYISDAYYKLNSNEDWFTIVIVHETAHQWWYSIVGDDEIDEAWLDEGFATYSEKIYNEMKLGKKDADRVFTETEEKTEQQDRSQNIIDGVVVKPLSDFKDWSDYAPSVYSRGAVTLNELRKKVGDEVFFKILQSYYADYKFKNAKTKDFINEAKKVSGQNLDSFFNSWLYGK